MSKKLITIILISYVIAIGVGVYGGMKYEQYSLQNQRRQFAQGNAGGSFQNGVNRRSGSDFLNGEVISKDSQSVTLKMPDGGSKIVFFSNLTQILKTTEGSISDIVVGEQIMVTGSQNSDGSYTAQTIQERQLPPQNNNK